MRPDAPARQTSAMATTPAPDVWLDERLVRAESSIEGKGLFFTADIPAATEVIRLGGRLVSTDELQALIAKAEADPESPFVDTITVYADSHLVLPPQTAVHFGNHSCDPTLWHVGPFAVATRRDVEAGEEATIDYGTQSGAPGFAMECRCGTQLCRGLVTSSDWRRVDLQERYEGHWVPALQTRVDRVGGTGVPT